MEPSEAQCQYKTNATWIHPVESVLLYTINFIFFPR